MRFYINARLLNNAVYTLLTICGISCGQEATSGSINEDVVYKFSFLSSSLPSCNNGSDGEVWYVWSESKFYICKGDSKTWVETNVNGLNSAVRLTTDPDGENCPNGGYFVQFGLDTNRNDALDDAEVATSATLCNGNTGSSGAQGQPGSSGHNALIRSTDELAGANCTAGGIKIDVGLDLNDDGELQANEIQKTEYICNGLDSNQGPPCQDGDGVCPPWCNANTDNDCVSVCGNKVVEPSETCDSAIPPDQPGTCPTSCDDGNACTVDSSTGSAANCNLVCIHQVITQCTNDDSCCPAGCNIDNDNDCSASCGDGIVTPPETCDKAIPAGQPGACPTTCNDGIACTIDVATGSVANCNLVCSHQTITQCANGDGCCAAGCNANNDNDCSPTCGNGVVEAGETCDKTIPAGSPGACPTTCNDGNACTNDRSSGSADACSLVCSHQAITQCANGDECCPQGCNANNDDNCSPTCGNGAIETGEVCDTAIASGLPGSCPTTCDDGAGCTIDFFTGSACTLSCAHQTITQCANGDGCCPDGCNIGNDNDCSASCGDGVVTSPETCDEGIASGQPGACPANCNDGNVCTDDTLSNKDTCTAKCVYTSNTASCDDGDACTENDACHSGTCSGTQKSCPAPDECHGDGSCSGGSCSNPPANDGGSCNGGTGTCSNGVCVPNQSS